MNKLKNLFKSNPVFLYLLPVFFVLHGFTKQFDLVPVKDAVILVLIYLGFAIAIMFLSWLLYRDFNKAALTAFVIMCLFLFFGNIHDFLKNVFDSGFIVRYTFLLPVIIVLLTVFIIWLKKTKNRFSTTIKYLNWLFLLFIAVDAGILTYKISVKKKPAIASLPPGFTRCDSCSKPDIYLIIADEYAGNKELKEILHFDNSAFENELKKKGFYIINDSKSNYNSTPFSVASLLNMDFIPNAGNELNDSSLNHSYRLINNNALTSALKAMNYDIINYSVFPFDNQPNIVNSTFFHQGTDLFTAQTFPGRFNSDIRFNLITRFRIKSEIKGFLNYHINNNKKLVDKTIDETKAKREQPKLVYLHTMMPHFPYCVNKNGELNYSLSFVESDRANQAFYLEYLQYSNKVFLDLISQIQKNSPAAVIIFMSDHGFRHLENQKDAHFININSIYLPGKNYEEFYDGMSNVNEFRVVFNTLFHQNLPLLKDSTIFLKNWW